MSKFQIAVLVLLAVTMIYGVALALSVQAYNEHVQSELDKCEPGTYIDFEPYWWTKSGRTFLTTSKILLGLWAATASLFIYTKLRTRSQKATVLIAIIMLFVAVYPIRAFSTPDQVNVLCVLDDDAYWNYEMAWETYLDDAHNHFLSEFNIDFGFICWNFTSYTLEPQSSIRDYLKAVIKEQGWHWNQTLEVTEFDPSNPPNPPKYNISLHLMIVFSGFGDLDALGISMLHHRAIMIKCGSNIYELPVLLHEIGHQFTCEHCSGDFCYMNPDAIISNTASEFCEGCSVIIMDNRECFLNSPPSTGSGGAGTGWRYQLR